MALDYLIRILADGKQPQAEASKVASSFGKIESIAGKLGGMLAGGLIVGRMLGLARETLEFAGSIQDASDKTGVGSEKLQEWAYSAKMTGAQLQDVTSALRRLTVSMVDASNNPKSDAASAFRRLGFALGWLKVLKPEQMFEAMAIQIKRLPESAQLTADILTLMGKSADTLVPAFKQGFVEMSKAARDLGVVLDKDVISRLGEIGDKLDKIKMQSVTSLGNPLAGPESATFLDFVSNFIGIGEEQNRTGERFHNRTTPWPLWNDFAYGPFNLAAKAKAAWDVSSHSAEIGDRNPALQEAIKARELQKQSLDELKKLNQNMKNVL